MTEQEENELIAEHLLGWRRCRGVIPTSFVRPENEGRCGVSEPAPWFNDWESAGLILDAFERQSVASCVWQLHHNDSVGHGASVQWSREGIHHVRCEGQSAPAAIRTIALKYLNSIHKKEISQC